MKFSPTLVYSLIAISAGLLFCRQTIAVPTNLALNGTASASSEREPDLGLYSPSNAIDGNRAGRNAFNDEIIWHSIQSSAPPPEGPNTQFQPLWFEVDLGADHYLDRVEIFSRLSLNPLTVNAQFPAVSQHLIQNFRIDVFNSSNMNVFTKTYLPSKSTDDEPWATSDMRNVVGQRVRLTRDPRHKVAASLANSAMALAEFEVWGQTTPILQNLAQNGTVSASPHHTLGLVQLPAERAIDGNLSGHLWHEGVYQSNGAGTAPYLGPYGNGHFWQVELQQMSQINYVTLYARTDGEPSDAQATGGTWHGGNKDFRSGQIRISILGADGTTVVSSLDDTLGGDDGSMQRYDLTKVFDTNPVGKFVRIEMLDTSKTLSLGEVEVFGTPQLVGSSIPEPFSAVPFGIALVGWLAMHRHRRF